MRRPVIRKISRRLPVLDGLAEEARGEGFRFVDRLVCDWEDSTNRFDGPGECLLGVYRDNLLVAVGGLNRDPYSTAECLARIRHFYVLRAFRRTGIGRNLLESLIQKGSRTFSAFRLRTANRQAALFYERFGFRRVNEPDATHRLFMTQPLETPLDK